MKLRAVLLLFGSILAVAIGQKKCQDHQECVHFEDCAEYNEYVGKPNKLWPKHVRDEVARSICAWDWAKTKWINKICCNPNPVTTTTSIRKSGLDLLDFQTCGKISADRIAGGIQADVFQFPWMALLGDINKEFRCGGSLIAESFVLTAAHCNQPRVFYVRVGETDLSTPIDCNVVDGETDCAEPHQDIPVEDFIRHKKYSASQKKHDIALVKLKTPAKLSYSVQPICLPHSAVLPNKIPSLMVVSGWGFTEHQHATSSKLLYASVPIVDQKQCQESIRSFSNVFTVDESQVCAGLGKNGSDHCKGDSGGPLQYYGKTGQVVHGVVAWGLKTCGNSSAPGVYTKVAHYLDWIIANLK